MCAFSLSNQLTTLLNFVELGPSWEATSCAATKKFTTFYEIHNFITMKNGVCWDLTPCGSCKNHKA
jgi:hypothetical protein